MPLATTPNVKISCHTRGTHPFPRLCSAALHESLNSNPTRSAVHATPPVVAGDAFAKERQNVQCINVGGGLRFACKPGWTSSFKDLLKGDDMRTYYYFAKQLKYAKSNDKPTLSCAVQTQDLCQPSKRGIFYNVGCHVASTTCALAPAPMHVKCTCKAGYEPETAGQNATCTGLGCTNYWSCKRIDECRASANPCGAANTDASRLHTGESLARCDLGYPEFAEKSGHKCVCADSHLGYKKHRVLAPTSILEFVVPRATSSECLTDVDPECDGYVCKSIDYCASNPCSSKYATCRNMPATERGYTCDCLVKDVAYAYEPTFACPCPCGAFATCNDAGANDTIRCSCRSGFYLPQGEPKFGDCTNIDERDQAKHPGEHAKAKEQCGTNAEVRDLPGSYHCSCKEGYKKVGRENSTNLTQTPCENIDECAARTDSCDPTSTVCSDIDGAFECICREYFERDESAGKQDKCERVNRCLECTQGT